MKSLTIKKVIEVFLLVAGLATIVLMSSCKTSGGCNGSSKMIGYGTSTSKVLKNNR